MKRRGNSAAKSDVRRQRSAVPILALLGTVGTVGTFVGTGTVEHQGWAPPGLRLEAADNTTVTTEHPRFRRAADTVRYQAGPDRGTGPKWPKSPEEHRRLHWVQINPDNASQFRPPTAKYSSTRNIPLGSPTGIRSPTSPY